MKFLIPAIAIGWASAQAGAAIFALPASMDNTLFESATGALSNGAGPHLYAGRTGVNAGFQLRRAVLEFDVAAAIPAGATINSVTLRLTLNASSPGQPTAAFELHRLLSSWGEGTSNAGTPGGEGAPATNGDATWLHRSFPGTSWVNPGGDFLSTASATANGRLPGTVDFTSAQLADDVRSWIAAPASNFGWILIGDEVRTEAAKRFASSENPTPANRPALIVDFTPVPEPSALPAAAVAILLLPWRPRRARAA